MSTALTFETRTPVVRAEPARADVACFVGPIALRPGALGPDVRTGWRDLGFGELVPQDPAARPSRHLPVMVDSEAAFGALFESEVRNEQGLIWEGYTAGAVRDFFRQGGQRAWVVPTAEPGEPPRDESEVLTALDQLIPPSSTYSASDRGTWTGMGHLAGLSEVAMVCLPDLPNSVGAPLVPEPTLPGEEIPTPGFVECSRPSPEPPILALHRAPAEPRLEEAQWGQWQGAVRRAVAWVARYRPDVQLILGLPLWHSGDPGHADPLSGLGSRFSPFAEGGVGSAHLQLTYPWVSGSITQQRPGGLAPSDGIVAGLLARSCLQRGAFRPAVGSVPSAVQSLSPKLSAKAVRAPQPLDAGGGRLFELSLSQRVSLLSPSSRAFQLLSDVTTSAEPSWRQAGANRLMGLLRRACERIGETMTFQSSSPRTWRALRRRMEDLLAVLQAEGAFDDRGEPYSVRCDETTMTQNDIDNGRLVAEVLVTPATSIERIAVVLAVVGPGQVRVRMERAA